MCQAVVCFEDNVIFYLVIKITLYSCGVRDDSSPHFYLRLF